MPLLVAILTQKPFFFFLKTNPQSAKKIVTLTPYDLLYILLIPHSFNCNFFLIFSTL